MSVGDRLASSLDRNDEQPNIALAEELARTGNREEIDELAALLTGGPKPLRHDAIKAMYELGERRPDLIAAFLDTFLDLLKGKDNRMLWGAMSALAALAPQHPDSLMPHLDAILDAADRSSVIAKDKLMVILSELNRDTRFRPLVTPVILDRLRHAAVNQLPMYAELTAPTLAEPDKPALRKVLEQRLIDLPYPPKRKRIEKVLNRL